MLLPTIHLRPRHKSRETRGDVAHHRQSRLAVHHRDVGKDDADGHQNQLLMGTGSDKTNMFFEFTKPYGLVNPEKHGNCI